MIKERAIIVDCDDTLVDYLKGFREFYNKNYEGNLDGYPSYYDCSDWIKKDGAELFKIFKEFNESSDEFSKLEPIDNVDALREIYKCGIKIIVLTKCGTDKFTVDARRVNLLMAYGDIFEDIIHLDYTVSKKETLVALQEKYDILFFIDDSYQNALDGLSVGVKTLVFERTHNKKHKYVSPFTFYSEWDSIIKNEINIL